MRPVTAAFLTAINASHKLAVQVDVLRAGAVVRTLDTITAGAVTLNAKAAVRGRLDLTLVDDGNQGLVPVTAADDLAPYGNELHVHRGIRYPGGGAPELVSLGVFRIDDCTVDDTATGQEIKIAGQDRAARIIDARFEEPYQVAAGTNVATAILNTVSAVWPDIVTSFAATTLTTPNLIAEEGGDRWKLCQDIATAAALRLFFDGDGVLVLAPDTTGGDPVAEIVEGDRGVTVTAPTLLSAGRRWSRVGSYNAAIVTGENTGETAPARGVARDLNALSPTYYYGPFGQVPVFLASQLVKTDAQAAGAAQALLQRQLGTTQSVGFGAIVNPALEPDDVVLVNRARAGIVQERHIIDQVTVPLGAAEAMTAQTRAVQVTS